MRSCEICHKTDNLRYCARCGNASYCCQEHQKNDWNKHRKVCKKPSHDETSTDHDKKQDPEVQTESILSDIGDLSIRAEDPQFMPQWVAQNSLGLNVLDELSSRERDIIATITSNLKQLGICVIDNFLDENSATKCLEDAVALHCMPKMFMPGQVVDQGGREKIRGDEIVWLEGSEENAKNISYVCRKIDTIISKCNSRIGYKISQRTKAMLACYPGNGAAYKCHIDNPSGDGRCITAIYYMNKNWDRDVMGGILRLYPKAFAKSKVAEVVPHFNRLLLFYSDSRNPHEVLPAFAERFAVTIWYFDEEERAKALASWAKNLPRR